MKTLNINTYPRSGTHFSMICLSQAFPGYTIMFGEHNIKNISGVENLFSTLRNPVDSVSSRIEKIIYENKAYKDIKSMSEMYLYSYIKWNNEIINNFDNVYVSIFENLILNPDKEMLKYSLKYKLLKPKELMVDSINDIMKRQYKRHFPRQYIEIKNEIISHIQNSNNISYAQNKYEELHSMCIKIL